MPRKTAVQIRDLVHELHAAGFVETHGSKHIRYARDDLVVQFARQSVKRTASPGAAVHALKMIKIAKERDARH